MTIALRRGLATPLLPAALAALLSAALLLGDLPFGPALAWLLMGVTAGYALSGSV